MANKPVPLGPFRGLNNRLPDHQLGIYVQGRKAGDYLRNAVNVDLTEPGTLQRRPGTTRAVTASDAHSLWGDERGAYFIDGERLFAYPQTMVRDNLTPGLRASYARDATGGVIWSNGVVIERIAGEVSAPLAPLTPNPEPQVVATTGGALPAGSYQLAVVALAEGGESAPTWPVQVTVEDGGAIDVSGLAGEVRLYLSAHNGDVLFLAAETTSPTYRVATLPPTDAPQLTTLGLRAMPPGHLVRVYRGRALVAAGSVLYVSEPYAYGLYNPLRGFVPFPARITVCEPCDDGVYVAADRTYWLAGNNPADSALAEVLPHGATEGSGGRNPEDKTVFWFSDAGVVVGAPGGVVKNIQRSTVAVGAATFGAMSYRDQDGLRQLVASVFGAQPTSAVATSFAEAEVVRKENML